MKTAMMTKMKKLQPRNLYPLDPQLKLQIKVKKCPTMKKVIMTKNTSRKMHSLNPKLKF
jgi:hypothetical protein